MIPGSTPVHHRASEEDPCSQLSLCLLAEQDLSLCWGWHWAGFVLLLLLGLALGSSGPLLAFC